MFRTLKARGLFAKIFLWFWLAMLLVVLVLLAVVRLTLSPPPFGRGHPPPSFDRMHLFALADVLERGGMPALTDFLDTVGREDKDEVLLLDSAGTLLLGPRPDVAELDLARRAQASHRRLDEAVAGREVGAFPASLSDGRAVVLLRRASPRNRWPESLGQMSRRLSFMLLGADSGALILRLLALLVTATLLCVWLTRYLTLPILALRQATRRLAQGELDVRVAPLTAGRQDELADLAQDLDKMAERLQELLKRQKRLLGDISHELRSPLARLNVALELARGQAGPAAGPTLDRIGRESTRLEDLVSQLLTLSSLEMQSSKLSLIGLDLGALVKQVAEDADFEARGRKCSVKVEASEGCSVRGSAELLRRAVENVVRNAVRYTDAGTVIELAVRRCEVGGRPHAVVTVRDHGPGVAEANLGRLFDPFFRCDVDRDRRTGGVGLGLAITQRAVATHGGSVRAANAPDGGLLVELTLPLAPQG